MILERVTFTKPRPPTDYSLDIEDRWNAIKGAYHLERNRERFAEQQEKEDGRA